jgi:hypothetical protein
MFNEQWPIVFVAFGFADAFFARGGFADKFVAFAADLAFFVRGNIVSRSKESSKEGDCAGRSLLFVSTSASGRFFVTKASIVQIEALD